MNGLMGWEELVGILRTCRQRWRMQRAAVWALRGVAAGLALSLILAILARLFPLLPLSSLVLLNLALVFLGASVAFGLSILRSPSLFQTARLVDHRLSLRERLSTALAVQAGTVYTSPPLAAAQLADAVRVAARIEPGRAFPWRMPRRELGVVLLLAAVLIASFVVPNPMEAVWQRRAAARQAVAEQVAELEALRAEIEANQSLSAEQREALLQELDELIRDLREGNLSQEEAVARLSETEQRLMALRFDSGQALRQEDAAAQRAGLEEAARAWQDSDLTDEIAEALQRGDYQAAAGELARYATTEGESLTREEELALADELAQAAEALAESNPELAEQLNEAAEALRRGDVGAARRAIAQASEQLAQAGQRIAGQEAVEEALAAVQEGRQAVAQAGQGAGQQQARGTGQGQQGQPGAGQRQAQGQPGSGSGEGESAGQEGQAQAGEGPIPQANRPGQEGESEYESVYAPQRLGEGEGERVNLPGEGEGPYRDTSRDVDEEGQALVPYNQVYGDYSQAAAEALEASYIPLGIKEYVREYFSALEP